MIFYFKLPRDHMLPNVPKNSFTGKPPTAEEKCSNY